MHKLVSKANGFKELRLEIFCVEIAKGKTQSDALRSAFPHVANWEPRSIWTRASILASKEKVAHRIEELRADFIRKLGISAERVLQERARLAFFDPSNLFDEYGAPLPINAIDEDTRAAIQGLEVAEIYEGTGQDRIKVGNMHKIKLADKSKSLEALEKHLGLYKEIEQSNTFFNITIHA